VLVNVRLAVVGELPMLPAEPLLEAREVVVAQNYRRVYLGTWVNVPVYHLDALQPDCEVEGPAVFESATTTVLIRHDDRAQVTPHGWLDIRVGSDQEPAFVTSQGSLP
jgi:N-methylhydantoinase A